jgi:hypothetical protein
MIGNSLLAASYWGKQTISVVGTVYTPDSSTFFNLPVTQKGDLILLNHWYAFVAAQTPSVAIPVPPTGFSSSFLGAQYGTTNYDAAFYKIADGTETTTMSMLHSPGTWFNRTNVYVLRRSPAPFNAVSTVNWTLYNGTNNLALGPSTTTISLQRKYLLVWSLFHQTGGASSQVLTPAEDVISGTTAQTSMIWRWKFYKPNDSFTTSVISMSTGYQIGINTHFAGTMTFR